MKKVDNKKGEDIPRLQNRMKKLCYYFMIRATGLRFYAVNDKDGYEEK